MASSRPKNAPQLFILSGPNGSGKSTTARVLLPKSLGVQQFVNADNIAEGLSPFAPETTAIQAGRLMIQRIQELMSDRQSFAFETTLAGKRNASLIKSASKAGYSVNLIYIWLSSPELALSRVADRVRQGGHPVPDDVVRRRYSRGLVNFFRLYRPLANTWTLCDNSGRELLIVAQGSNMTETRVFDEDRLHRIEQSARDAEQND
jgi:predicted ABC-type ATPase